MQRTMSGRSRSSASCMWTTRAAGCPTRRYSSGRSSNSWGRSLTRSSSSRNSGRRIYPGEDRPRCQEISSMPTGTHAFSRPSVCSALPSEVAHVTGLAVLADHAVPFPAELLGKGAAGVARPDARRELGDGLVPLLAQLELVHEQLEELRLYLENVLHGEKAYHLVLVHHGKMPDVVLSHEHQRIVHIGIRRNGDQLRDHDVAQRGLRRGLAWRDDLPDDVLLGDDALRAALLDDNHRADVLLRHDAGALLHRDARRDGDGLLRHRVAHLIAGLHGKADRRAAFMLCGQKAYIRATRCVRRGCRSPDGSLETRWSALCASSASCSTMSRSSLALSCQTGGAAGRRASSPRRKSCAVRPRATAGGASWRKRCSPRSDGLSWTIWPR